MKNFLKTRQRSLVGLMALVGLALLVALGLPGWSQAKPNAKIRIKGSDTMLHLLEQWAQAFMATHSGIVVEVDGGGTGKGVRALIDGQVDLASASRPLKPKEAHRLFEKQGTLGYAVLTARDAITVYLHADNPVRNLTLAQLRGIFTGEIKSWNDVGGRDQAIAVKTRNSVSGTYVFFSEHVLEGDSFSRKARILPTTQAIVRAVDMDANAIGFAGALPSAAQGKHKARPCRIEDVEPTAENVRNGTYPIARYLYLYTSIPPEGDVRQLVDWILGPEGQSLAAEIGYIPLRE